MKKSKSTTKEGTPTLKSLIESAGYTQISLAKELNLSASIIGYYVAGEKKPRVDRFLEICERLNVSPKTLAKSMGMDVSRVPDDCPKNNATSK